MAAPRVRYAIGVDPGLVNAAWALIQQKSNGELQLLDSDVCSLRRTASASAESMAAHFCHRLALEACKLDLQCDPLAVVAIEDQQCIMRRNVRVYAMGLALTVGLHVAFEPIPDVTVRSLSPTQWKRELGIPFRGDHKLNKSLAVALAEATFGHEFATDHEADAALVALAALKHIPWT